LAAFALRFFFLQGGRVWIINTPLFVKAGRQMDKNCSSCGQKDRCQEIYEKMGRAKGPNVALKALFAFVLPVAVFVLAAGVAQPWLNKKIENHNLIIVIQLIIGLAAATVIMCIGKCLFRRVLSGQRQCPQKDTLNKEE
jgi:hypothetical protein